MSVSARARRIAIVLGVVLAVVTAPVWAQALSGLVPVTGSVPMETNSGLTVTVGGASDLSGSDFVTDDTLYVQTDQGNLTAEAIANSDATVQASQITGTYTNVTGIDATSAQILLAPEDKANLTVSGGVTAAAWRDYGVDTGQTAAVISGSGSSTITAYGLPSDTRVWAIDAQTGQLVAQDVTDGNGDGIFSFNASTGTHAVALPNGEIKQSWSDTDRHLRFVTGPPGVQLEASAIADDGMNVTVTGTGQLETDGLFPFSNTVNATVGSDYVEFTASGTAAATGADTDLEGPFTNLTAVDASSTTITADPGDKAQLSVSGAADAVAWSDYQVDDGQADAVISGPDGTSSDVTFYGLSADTTYSAINATTGQVLAVSDSTSFGQVTFEIRHSEQTILLQTGDQSIPPQQSNASPTGDLTQPPSDLSVDVSDPDFAGEDTVNVTIAVDGSQVLDTSITSNQTLSAALPNDATLGGTHSWYVNTTDRFGNVVNTTYTYNVPSKIYIYNVTPNNTGGYDLIQSPVEMRATFAGSDETVLRRSTPSGVIDFTGLPPDESYVVTLKADGYFTRSAYVPSLYTQEAVFMLNETADSVENSVQIEDRTGQFRNNPVLQIQHVINRSNVTELSGSGYDWVTVAGDRIGATDFFITNLQTDERYRFVITNQEGDRRILGEYVAQATGPLNLEIGEVRFSAEVDQGVAVQANLDRQVVNESTGQEARLLRLIAYTPEGNANTITYRILEANNDTVIASNVTAQLGSRETVLTRNLSALDPNAPEDQNYRVQWWIEKTDGSVVSDTDYVGTVGPLGFGLAENVLNLIGWVGLIAFAGFAALRSPKMSVVGTPVIAAGMSMFGVVAIPNVLLIMAGAIGAFYLIGETQLS